MKLLVTQIEFDFNDSLSDEYSLSLDEQNSITNDNIGIWEVDSYSALIPKIERTLGHKVSRIDYTANLLHSLTSYL